MDRRDMIKTSLAAGAVASIAGAAATLPERDRAKVAFLQGEGANVIDLAGPWEVFQDTNVAGRRPFELCTVGQSLAPVTMTGGFRALPHHDVANAPQPNVIVVGAQRSHPDMLDWLRRASAGADVTMSVCTGAFQLARAGLLERVPATTHHDYWDSFAEEFPGIELRRGPRFVDSGRIATAGGLTSGIDMALHVVQLYFGDAAAAATATYMEHDSAGWRTGLRAG